MVKANKQSRKISLIKKPEEIEVLAEGGRILGEILLEVAAMARPGATTADLEERTLDMMEKKGGRPAFKNLFLFNDQYFPTALCTSLNEEIVHCPAIPGRKLKEGDILSIDVGMEYPLNGRFLSGQAAPLNPHSPNGGFYTDTAVTVAIGDIGLEASHLIETTRRSLATGIAMVKPGLTLSRLGAAIQAVAEEAGYGVVRELVGHGVGYDVHEDPQVPNYLITDRSLKDMVLKTGMVIAIEPMVTMGDYRIQVAEDGLSILTADNSLSAHFEHTIAVTESGCRIITQRPEGSIV
jgi:methionyl aminopeptidase